MATWPTSEATMALGTEWPSFEVPRPSSCTQAPFLLPDPPAEAATSPEP